MNYDFLLSRSVFNLRGASDNVYLLSSLFSPSIFNIFLCEADFKFVWYAEELLFSLSLLKKSGRVH